jgi:hypothetical protein
LYTLNGLKRFILKTKKMKKYILYGLCVGFLTNGFAQKSLLKFENDVLDSTDKSLERYNRDNKIYTSKTEFIFDSLRCQFSNQEYGIPNWQLIMPEKADALTAFQIGILVLPYYLNDNQTGMEFKFYDKEKKVISAIRDFSGLVENDKNVWLHPMRTQFFGITEFNSFPYIKAPYKIGTKWQSGLGIGYFSEYERFDLKWEGVLDSKEDLEIIDKVNLSTPLGDLDCWVVQGICKTQLTDTKTLFYFNEKYGFVKIIYDLFDKSRLELTLKEVKQGVESTMKW